MIKDGQVRPCDHCLNCQSFNNHAHSDIIEIDAASKTGVDDIRQIIESSEYKSLLAEYKVFIIDEVHMLSKGAFNALLRTLEEPPERVVFIFATTEAQKIPNTIISRCQRYDLRRLTFNEILSLLNMVVNKENLRFEQEALKVIAFNCEGSARDALALLDQASCFAAGLEDAVTVETINKMLGLVGVSNIIKLLLHISNKEVSKALELVNNVYISSGDIELLLRSASDFLAYLNKAKLLPNYIDSIYESYQAEIKEILSKNSLSQISVLWQIFNKGIIELKSAHNQLMICEMVVIKAIYFCTFPEPEQLIAKPTHPLEAAAEYDEDKIVDFLRYVYSHKEIGIYYLLLNEVEIKGFADNILTIAGSNITEKTKQQISNLLAEWAGEKWRVTSIVQTKIVSLKEQLINKAKKNEQWKMINEKFPFADISDILLKNK